MIRLYNSPAHPQSLPGLERWLIEEDDFPRPIKAVLARSGWGDACLVFGFAGHILRVPHHPEVPCGLFVLGKRGDRLISILVVSEPPRVALPLPHWGETDPWTTLLWAGEVEAWHFGASDVLVIAQMRDLATKTVLGTEVSPDRLVQLPQQGVTGLHFAWIRE